MNRHLTMYVYNRIKVLSCVYDKLSLCTSIITCIFRNLAQEQGNPPIMNLCYHYLIKCINKLHKHDVYITIILSLVISYLLQDFMQESLKQY